MQTNFKHVPMFTSFEHEGVTYTRIRPNVAQTCYPHEPTNRRFHPLDEVFAHCPSPDTPPPEPKQPEPKRKLQWVYEDGMPVTALYQSGKVWHAIGQTFPTRMDAVRAIRNKYPAARFNNP